jgi:hypothetical protein
LIEIKDGLHAAAAKCTVVAGWGRLHAFLGPPLTQSRMVQAKSRRSPCGTRDFAVSGTQRLTTSVTQPFAISRIRKGRSTRGAMIAAMMFRTAAIIKTAVQLPVADINTLPSGTKSAAVPLAVYNMP